MDTAAAKSQGDLCHIQALTPFLGGRQVKIEAFTSVSGRVDVSPESKTNGTLRHFPGNLNVGPRCTTAAPSANFAAYLTSFIHDVPLLSSFVDKQIVSNVKVSCQLTASSVRFH